MKVNLLTISVLVFQSCSWFESDYDKLINSVKELKAAEKKAGKPNPIFDGVIEPDFPNEKENDQTIEGVDSNHDGVRDDIEIWINRTAEDQYVRIELKEYYQKLFKKHTILLDVKARDYEKEEKESEFSEAMRCLGRVLFPYEKKYLEKKIEIYRQYNKYLMQLTFNNSQRSKLVALANSYQYKNTRDIDTNDNSYCSKKIPQSYFKKIIREAQER